nr:MAG TPA: DNA polymerase [Caudoviricetes sp.]
MKYSIFDIETDGLLPTVGKIHCLSYRTYENGTLLDKNTLFSEADIRHYFEEQEVVIGHNVLCYDLPVLEKIYGIKFSKNKVIDTLGLSWYLYVGRKSHGLESWGEELGVEKPKIEDWKNLSHLVYAKRCERDVEINELLFVKQIELLKKLYPKHADRQRIINYLNFKMDCLREQDEVKIKIDIPLLEKSLNELETMYNEKYNILKSVMPGVAKYKVRRCPKNMYKANGHLSAKGKEWLDLLREQGFADNYDKDIKIFDRYEEPNPTSTTQIKEWLYSLGWKPDVFNEVKNKKTNTSKEVEQIYNDKKELNESVKELYSVCPELEHLNMFSLIGHRIGIFKSFRDNLDENGFVVASTMGLTNTNRFKHRSPCVNLPKPNTFYGKQIRGLLIIPDDSYIMIGSDLSSAEDTTKQNYMYKFDPDYVTKMRTPGFDPHIEVAVFVNLMTREQANRFKELDSNENKTEEEKKEFSTLKSIRSKAKTVNFASVYKVGAKTLAKNLGCTEQEAENILDGYWTMNKAVLDVEKDLYLKVIHKSGEVKIYKTVSFLPKDNSKEEKKRCQKLQNSFLQTVDTMYILNPVSDFWQSLRYFKDIFSTLNQSTAVFVFDCYLKESRKYLKVQYQVHDEWLACYKKDKYTQQQITKVLKKCITRVNDKLKLPIPMDISADFGTNYAQCH